MLAMASTPAPAAWLDQTVPAAWNHARMAVPRAPEESGNDDWRCRRSERPPETSADRAVARAGWRLFREFQGGWGVRVVWGLVTYDGMCRPMAYQAFVFVGDTFAGTLSPVPMASRSDGSLTSVSLTAAPPAGGPAVLAGAFVRYTENDPLCCPSRTTHIRYRIDGKGRGVVVVPAALDTVPTAR